MASALAINCRLSVFLEPISRKVGSWERRLASLTSSYPPVGCISTAAQGQPKALGILAPAGINQVLFQECARARRSSSSRTRISRDFRF